VGRSVMPDTEVNTASGANAIMVPDPGRRSIGDVNSFIVFQIQQSSWCTASQEDESLWTIVADHFNAEDELIAEIAWKKLIIHILLNFFLFIIKYK